MVTRESENGQGRASAPQKEWYVRQAEEDKGLAALLNELAGEGWQVYAIFEPRGGAYRVVAWREGAGGLGSS